VDWIHLAHDRDYWRVLVNALMNLRVSSWGGGVKFRDDKFPRTALRGGNTVL
jgi:hypothetical protein